VWLVFCLFVVLRLFDLSLLRRLSPILGRFWQFGDSSLVATGAGQGSAHVVFLNQNKSKKWNEP